MKKIIKYIGMVVLVGLLTTACEKDFTNINAPADNQVFLSKDGL